jgi:hypothetical protein
VDLLRVLFQEHTENHADDPTSGGPPDRYLKPHHSTGRLRIGRGGPEPPINSRLGGTRDPPMIRSDRLAATRALAAFPAGLGDRRYAHDGARLARAGRYSSRLQGDRNALGYSFARRRRVLRYDTMKSIAGRTSIE